MAISIEARRPGRPPNVDSLGVATAHRLLAAAIGACVQRGFEGVTMADIARRADISAPAIYNHYEGKAQLLVAAGKWALERITTRRDRQVDPEAIVRAFLAPGFADTRRLLVELHLAGQRHPDVAELLAAWHRKNTLAWLPFAGGDDPKATVTTFFAFLLGLCQIDSLLGAEADRQAVVEAAVATLSVLFPEGVRP